MNKNKMILFTIAGMVVLLAQADLFAMTVQTSTEEPTLTLGQQLEFIRKLERKSDKDLQNILASPLRLLPEEREAIQMVLERREQRTRDEAKLKQQTGRYRRSN